MAICKLCKQDKELRDSHYIPAAVYAELRDETDTNPNPVMMDGTISLVTSRQITGYFLCGDCEQRFSKFGETWVLGNMWKRTSGFPLQDLLSSIEPVYATDSFAQYKTNNIPEIDMDALVYFALSIFWRGSAIVWRSAGGPLFPGIDLGPFEEPVRRFLLGGEFPKDIVVLVAVWPLKEVLHAAHTQRATGKK